MLICLFFALSLSYRLDGSITPCRIRPSCVSSISSCLVVPYSVLSLLNLLCLSCLLSCRVWFRRVLNFPIQAIVDFLLTDPEDEELWEGIILPPPFPSSSSPSSRGAARELPHAASLSYWKSLLLDGALSACTPATGERCLRLALGAVGGGGGGGERTSGGARKEVDPHLVSSAVVVLRGLSRLARYG